MAGKKVDWKRLTDGLLTNSIDACLWTLFFVFDLAQRKSMYKAMAGESPIADSMLENFRKLRMGKVLHSASSKKLITSSGVQGKSVPIKITEAGLSRLRDIIPHYDPIRAWDETMYIVTYDITEQQRKLRHIMRKHLKTLGAAMLQKSVWITPYNPTDILKDFARENHLRGSVIISTLGKDGSIGDENLADLVARVHQLRQLNQRYENFVANWNKRNADSLAIAQFLSILRDDPQLPFALLPKWWYGDKAYQLVAPYLKRIYTSRESQIS